MIDAVPLTVALVPLGLYLLFIGAINLRRRPTLVSGTLDIVLLALAVFGMIIVGPLNLFMPDAAAMRFGLSVWVLLIAFYILCIVLYLLLARPRLVVFNISRDQLRSLAEQVARRLDPEVRLAGEAMHLPHLDVQFHIESTSGMRNVALVATGERQSHTGWQKLKRELSAALATAEVASNPRGFTFLTAGLILLCWPLAELVRMPAEQIAQEFRDLLGV